MKALIALALAVVGGSSSQVPEPTHPALAITKASVDAVWAKGFEDGQRKRDVKKAWADSEKEIDFYHTAPISKAPCSWAYLLHPRMLIYFQAHTAAAQYWTPGQIEKAKADLSVYADAEPKTLGFFVVLQEMPSFHGSYGRLERFADPTNLTDVHCVLKVGKRIIQPESQPGDLSLSKSDSLNFFTVPSTTFVYGRSSGSATAYGSGGYATATGTSYTSYAVTSYNQGSQPYSTYRGQFVALFPLRDADGKATIHPDDKEVELVIVKKSAELSARYKLSDWAKALEK